MMMAAVWLDLLRKRLVGSVLLPALMALLLPVGAFAQNIEWGGYVKFFAHPNLNSPYPFDRLGSRIQLMVNNSFSDKAAFYAALDFNYEETGREPGDVRSMSIYPVEAYIDLFFSKVDVRVGKQFIFWGKTDWINPTDNINPWDYKNISAEVEDYRIPLTALKADVYLGPFDLQAVVVPRFTPHLLSMETPDMMGIFPVRELNPLLPENKLANAEFGFRLQSSLFNTDYSLSYYNGYDKFPTLRMSFNPPGGEFLAQTEYNPYQVFGADFVKTFNKFALKGEGAYFLTDDRNGRDVFVKNPHLKYVVGADYNGFTDLTLNLQFVQTVLFKFDRDYEEAVYREMGMPQYKIPDKYTQSLSGRVQYQVGDFTSFQLITVVNLKDWDYFILPILNYGFMDGVNIYGGATIFGGPEDSVFGRNKKISRAFVEVKYSF